MVKIRHNVAKHKKRRRLLKRTKGQFGFRKSRYRQAKRSLIKGLVYQFRDRKNRKREFRSLWIVRINAACRQEGITYSRFMNGLINANVSVDRKMLADLAVNAPDAFKKLIDVAKSAPKKAAKKVSKAK